jgi:hypothetical protein
LLIGIDNKHYAQDEYFMLIGECYVDGKMEGEAIDNPIYEGCEREFYLT